MQGFERTLFRAPKQSDEQRPVGVRDGSNQLLLFLGKEVSDEIVAVRFNDFQVAAQCSAAVSNGAHGTIAAMAQGNCRHVIPVGKEGFRRAGFASDHFNTGKDSRMVGKIEVDGKGALGSPTAEAPIGIALGNVQAVEEA